MIDGKAEVKGYCDVCLKSWPVDLAKIAARKGLFWSLWERKVRCPKCRKPSTILATHPGGFFRPLHTDEGFGRLDVEGVCQWCGKRRL